MFFKLKELFRWRQLLFTLAVKDLKVKYRRATGGFGWMLVTPLIQMAIFVFIFGFLFKIRMKNYPLFVLSGLFPWSFLKSSLDGAVNSIFNNANLIKKTYFPREILPISNIITNLISFFFSLVTLFILSLFFKISLFPASFWFPLVIFIQIILIVGICLFLTGLNSVYRETRFIMDVILLVWFYATPIVYPLGMAKNILPQGLLFFYTLNPMVGIISAYQNIFIYGNIPDLKLLFLSFFMAIVFFILGFASFRRYEKIFVDMV